VDVEGADYEIGVELNHLRTNGLRLKRAGAAQQWLGVFLIHVNERQDEGFLRAARVFQDAVLEVAFYTDRRRC